MFNPAKNRMKQSISYTLILVLLLSLMSFGNIVSFAESTSFTQKAVSNNYSEYENGITVGNGLGNLTAYDVYVLEKEGADTSKWDRNNINLKEETIVLIDANRITVKIKAKAIAQTYLAAKEYGETSKAEDLLSKMKNEQNLSTGVFGDNDIYSNMAAYDMFGSVGDLSKLNVDACKTYVMEEQNVEVAVNSDFYGAWGVAQWYQDTDGTWKEGAWGPDFISSAQGTRVLDYLYELSGDSDINNRKSVGLNWLLNKQQEDGSFVLNAWDDPVTNTAEMIITLDQLGQKDTAAWHDAVNYLESNALNDNGEFGNYGGIGNNTLIIEVYKIINGQSLQQGTVIDINITSDGIAIPAGLTKQFGVEAHKFGEGKESVSNGSITWSTSSKDIAEVSEGLLKLYGDEPVKITAQYSSFKDEKDVNRESNLSINAVRNNYIKYQEGAAIGDGWGNMTPFDVFVLEQEGVDTSTWERNGANLKADTIEFVDTYRTDSAIKIKAVTQSYLAGKEFNRTSAAILFETIKGDQNKTTGVFGDSDIYSNMPVYDMIGSVGELSKLDIDACKTYVMEEQNIEVAVDNNFYGAWGIAQWYQDTDGNWKQGAWGPDFISSVQGVRVLDYLYDLTSDSEIENRRTIGLDWLLKKQLENGSFMQNAWDDPVTNTAEMIITLDLLGKRDTEVWNNAVNYLENNALKDNGEFGSYGGIGNNTLMLQAQNVINEEQLITRTVIEMIINSSSVEMSVGDHYQNTVKVHKLNVGIEDIDEELVNWSISSNGSVASINNSGKVTAQAKGTAIATGVFNHIEKSIEVTVEGEENPNDPEETPDYIKITMYVAGIDDEIMYSDVLKITKDEDEVITVLDALDETGLEYKYRGDYVYKIDDLKEKATGPLSGWKYKVNGSVKDASASNCPLGDKAVVIWFFADNPSDNGPSLKSLIENENKMKEEEEEDIDINKAKEDAEKKLLEALDKGEKPVLEISKDDNGKVYLSPKTLLELTEKNMPLLLENGDIKIELKPNVLKNDAVNQGMENQKASVEIKVDELEKEEKEKLLEKVNSETLKKFIEAGGGIIDVKAQVVYSDSKGDVEKTDKINQFFEPVKITMNVSEDLREEDLKKLTGVRYETGEDGKVVPVKVGGVYDAESKTMTFYADRFAPYGIAQVDELRKINLQIEQPSTLVNEEEKEMDVAPTIINDRTMVPIRFISETFGAEVEWDEVTKTVTINYEGQVLELVVGETSETMDTPPTIVNDRTLVPLRYISETFDANVLWIPSSRSVEIVK